MISLNVKIEDRTRDMAKAAEKMNFRSFSHAAASIRKDAAGSIEQAFGPSAPGEPPHTHRRRFLARAIRYKANKEGAVIGAAASIVGQSGSAHEHGGEYKGQTYPARPFMQPALERAAPRLAGNWRGSLGS